MRRDATRPVKDESVGGELATRQGVPDLTVTLAAENAQLREENSTLREAVMARDAFLAVAAHELRNPMTPVQGRIELLRRLLQKERGAADLTDRLAQGLEQIEWLTARYVRRATTLLDVSRATTGKLHCTSVADRPLRARPGDRAELRPDS